MAVSIHVGKVASRCGGALIGLAWMATIAVGQQNQPARDGGIGLAGKRCIWHLEAPLSNVLAAAPTTTPTLRAIGEKKNGP